MTQNVQQHEEVDSFSLTTEERGERYGLDEGYTDWADIYRVYRDDTPRKLLYNCVTVKEAKEYCNDPRSKGDGWFDCWYRCE